MLVIIGNVFIAAACRICFSCSRAAFLAPLSALY